MDCVLGGPGSLAMLKPAGRGKTGRNIVGKRRSECWRASDRWLGRTDSPILRWSGLYTVGAGLKVTARVFYPEVVGLKPSP